MKRVAILGSTGSIGTQTLDIVRANRDKLQVTALVAYSNVAKLDEQVAEFLPKFCALISRDGEGCLIDAVQNCDIAVVATRGIAALDAILYCLDNRIDVALANKEALVCAGELVMSKVGAAKMYPVDSEHCAIAQCLLGHNKENVAKLLLTASGGPFWNKDIDELHKVTASDALHHPNWDMGSKITIDSATMMNKSLEVIEASFLFGIPVENIQIVVHRQSVVHSMVEFSDGSVIAQLASPDMRLPIQTALLGDTGEFTCKPIDFEKLLTLTFETCDYAKFPCAKLSYEVSVQSPLLRTVMNAANDVCVDAFLQGKLCFNDFYNIISTTVKKFESEVFNVSLTVDNIKKYDMAAKQYTFGLLCGEKC